MLRTVISPPPLPSPTPGGAPGSVAVSPGAQVLHNSGGSRGSGSLAQPLIPDLLSDAAPGPQTSPSVPWLPPPMTSPLSEGGGVGTGGTGGEVERLRAQLVVAQKREAVGAELRQVAEGYKAKAEKLSKTLNEERERAGAQSELWKQQLKTLRARAREEKEHSRQLEERLQAVMRGEGAIPMGAGTPQTASMAGTPQSLRSAPDSGASFAAQSPGPNVVPLKARALRDGVGKVLSSASLEVDRALDKVDGFVERLARNRDSKKGEYTPASTDGD